MIDDDAAHALLTAPPEVQQMVMARGSLAEANNPSIVLMARLRDAMKTAGPRAGSFAAPSGCVGYTQPAVSIYQGGQLYQSGIMSQGGPGPVVQAQWGW